MNEASTPYPPKPVRQTAGRRGGKLRWLVRRELP